MAATQIEIWKDVPDYEGLYQVSSLGRVRRITAFAPITDGLYQPVAFRVISLGTDRRTGYRTARLSNGKAKTLLAHRLVCSAFHGPPPRDKPHCAHGDGTRTNNQADNLRWASIRENAQDRRTHGTQQIGENVRASKLTADDVREIRSTHEGKYGDGARLARRFGVSGTQISHIVANKHWRHVV